MEESQSPGSRSSWAMIMRTDLPVAIVGAGPYGLSLAAHLSGRGVAHRVFGVPMQSWIEQMPEGMLLKSDGFASNLYEPDGGFGLSDFYAERSMPYVDRAVPVPRETFIEYGLAFQERFVPEVEEKMVRVLEPIDDHFRLVLDDGEQFDAARVVVATGMSGFGRVPEVLAGLPRRLVSHSSEHSSLAGFEGRSVAVVGAGSSALDLAALLIDRGVTVEIICRRTEVIFHERTLGTRPLHHRLRYPSSPMGPGWPSRLSADYARWFRLLPEERRLRFVREHLGPSGGWFIRDRVLGRVPMHTGTEVVSATESAGQVSLELRVLDGSISTASYDHVIAATGYRVDLDAVPFLGPSTVARLSRVGGFPEVSSTFESSVPGLHFIGYPSAACFGPLMRFACGAEMTSRRLSRHLSRVLPRTRVRAGRPATVPAEEPSAAL